MNKSSVISSEKDVIKCIKQDNWMLEVLQTVRALQLPDWWIGAGFVRNKVWDVLHNYNDRTPLNDVDVIYFNEQNIDETFEKEIEKKLSKKMPGVPWSAKNQARMAIIRNDGPYKNSSDGLSRWVETATCIGVSLDDKSVLHVTAPHGIDDLIHLRLRPGPAFEGKMEKFHKRIKEKKWIELWPKLQIV